MTPLVFLVGFPLGPALGFLATIWKTSLLDRPPPAAGALAGEPARSLHATESVVRKCKALLRKFAPMKGQCTPEMTSADCAKMQQCTHLMQLPGTFAKQVMLSEVLRMCIACILQCVYRKRILEKRPKSFPQPPEIPPHLSHTDGKGFTHSLKDCCNLLPLCCWVYWAGQARQGDTLQGANNISNYWAPFFLQMSCSFAVLLIQLWQLGVMFDSLETGAQMSNVPGLDVKLLIFLAISAAAVSAKWRGDLRKHLGADPATSKFLEDLLSHLFCSPCSVAQEALEVDNIQQLEMECCGLKPKNDPHVAEEVALVGIPITVVGAGASC